MGDRPIVPELARRIAVVRPDRLVAWFSTLDRNRRVLHNDA